MPPSRPDQQGHGYVTLCIVARSRHASGLTQLNVSSMFPLPLIDRCKVIYGVMNAYTTVFLVKFGIFKSERNYETEEQISPHIIQQLYRIRTLFGILNSMTFHDPNISVSMAFCVIP